MMQEKLDELFHAPTLPPSQLSPQRFPGVNLESLAALQEVLKDNHNHNHIFCNESGFHNHITHRALAVYALGGPAVVLRDSYKHDSLVRRPVIPSPETITEENFVDHLGDEKYYQSYIAFFSKQLSEKGATRTLEEFVFSEKYNFQEGRDADTQPEMLARLSAGLFHPLIHVGYGAEFGLKGMFVEGLAQTAVHGLIVKGSIPPSRFPPGSNSNVEHITRHLPSLALNTFTTANDPTVSKTGSVHAFDIAARILRDNKLRCKAPEDFPSEYRGLLIEFTGAVREHAEKWTIDLNQPGEIERKIEELIWLNSTLYGIGGSTPKGPQPDFFLMHTVTSSLFLHSLIVYLSPRSQILLLRSYLTMALTWWVIRGRPSLDIKSFMTSASVGPSVPTTPEQRAHLTTKTTPTPNPFLPILQLAIAHPNEHYIKIQRSFAHFNTIYGLRPAGYFRGTELEGAELLDGSLFLRSFLWTADYIGSGHEGEEPRPFNRDGFYE